MFYNELNDIKFNTNAKTDVLVLEYKNANFTFNDIDLFGQKSIDYITQTLSGFNFKIISVNANNDLINTIKAHLTNSDFTLVLYGDTPLISKETLLEIIDFATLKDLDICTLPRGYVFKNSYLNSGKETPILQNYSFKDSEFITLTNFASLDQIKNILQDKINLKHQLNGVNLLNSNLCYIDYNVIIEKNVTLHPNCVLKNNTKICENSIIFPHTYIDNSNILKNSQIYQSVIVNSEINENSFIKPFSHIVNNKNPNTVLS